MNHETPMSNFPDDEIDLRELIITLLKGWKIIIVCTFVVAVGAAFHAYRLPDQYVVVTKAASLRGEASSQMAGLAALAGVQVGGQSKEVDLMEHIDVVIKNSYFMDKLIGKKWVIPREQTKQELKDRAPLVFDTLTFAEYWELPEPDTTLVNWEYSYKMGLYGLLRSPKLGHLSVANDMGILEIKTKFNNPELSYRVHWELLTLLRDYFKNDYTNRDKEKRVFVEERLAEVDIELKKAEARLVRFREKNMLTTSPRVILEGERLVREIELQASLYKELIKQLEIAKIDEKKETPIFEVLQEPELPLWPASPNRKLIILICTVFGGASGVFLVFLIEWSKSFRKEDER